MMQSVKNNLYKFIMLGMLILSFCLLFTGCNLTTTTSSDQPITTSNITLNSPSLGMAKLDITKEQYLAIPKDVRPVLYNKTSNNTVTAGSVSNWTQVYYKAPFEQVEINKGKFVLSTTENVNARGYIFGIYDGQFEKDANGAIITDYSKFTKITSLKQENNQSYTYWSYDVSNYITQPKTYYFYVQALGKGYEITETQKTFYKDSPNSQIYSFTYTKPVFQTDKVEAQGHQISWNRVENVKGYEVYVNGTKAHDSDFLTGTSYNLEDTTIFNKLQTLPGATFEVKINSVPKEYYYLVQNPETDQNKVSVLNTINLSTPTGLNIKEESGSFIASWNKVEHTQNYEVVVVLPEGAAKDDGDDNDETQGQDLTIKYATNQTSCNLSDLITASKGKVEVGKYNIKVKAVGDNTTTFSSLYSNYVEFIKTSQIKKPTTITTSFGFNKNTLLVTWPEFPNAKSYSVCLKVGKNKNGSIQYLNYNSYCTATSCLLDLTKIMQDFLLYNELNNDADVNNDIELLGTFNSGKFETITISIKANGYSYYLDSEYLDIAVTNEQLLTPLDLKINGDYLIWDKVVKAEKYEITVVNNQLDYSDPNKNTVYETADNYYNLQNLKSVGNNFTIKVKAVSGIFKNSPETTINYVIHQKLDAVSEIITQENDSELSLSWQAVDNTTDYYVYVDLTKSQPEQPVGYSLTDGDIVLLKKITPMQDTITFTIKYSDLFESCGGVKYLKYYIYVVCYSSNLIYTNSDITAIEYTTKKLDTPMVSEHNRTLSWIQVDNALSYNIYLNGEFIESTNVISIDVSSYMTQTATYTFKVEACSTYFINSISEDIVINYSLGQLDAPTLIIVGTNLTWNAVDGAEYYEVYINNNLVENHLTECLYNLLTHCSSVGTYTVGVKALATNKDPSNICEISYVNGQGETLQITNHNAAEYTLEFNTITAAQKYDIYLNNTLVQSINATTAPTITYNYQSALTTFKSGYVGDAVSLTVSATNNVAASQNYSNSIYVYKKNSNATEFYYVFNTYYDNYIDNFDELVYVSLYTMVFGIEAHIVVNYSYTQANINNLLVEGINEMINFLPTFKMDRDLSKYTYDGNNATIKFVNCYEDDKTYSTHYTKSQNNPLFTNYVPSQVRGYGLPVTDSYAISINVDNSDELLWAVQFGARPVFNNSKVSLKCEEYYNRAKTILNTILPENATDYEKAYIIAEYIMANSWYDYGYSSVSGTNIYKAKYHFLEGFFDDGLVVCDGYAKIFSLLCNMEGIKTYVISGDAGGGHAWNKVYLDIDGAGSTYTSNWYLVDLTWCDSMVLSGKSVFMHEYFLLSDSNSLLDGRITYSKYYPGASHNFDYYKSNLNKLNTYLHSDSYTGTNEQILNDLLENVLYKMYINHETCVDIKVNKDIYSQMPTVLQTLCQKLYVDYGIDIGFGGNNELNYGAFEFKDNQNYIIILTMKNS